MAIWIVVIVVIIAVAIALVLRIRSRRRGGIIATPPSRRPGPPRADGEP